MSAVIPDPALTDWVPLGGVGGGGSMIALQEVVLGAAAASIDFASIPQTYRHLRIALFGRGDVSSPGVSVRLNGDAGANYDRQLSQAVAATVTASEQLAQTSALIGYVGSSLIAGVGSGGQIDIPDYTNTVFQKTILALTSFKSSVATGGLQVINGVGFWRSTAAINRVELLCGGGNFVAGTKATLYGLAAPGVTLLPTGVRAVWGRVNANGTIASGTGFTVSRTVVGQYTITFNTPFASVVTPIVSLAGGPPSGGASVGISPAPSANGFQVATVNNTWNYADKDFTFVAIEAA